MHALLTFFGGNTGGASQSATFFAPAQDRERDEAPCSARPLGLAGRITTELALQSGAGETSSIWKNIIEKLAQRRGLNSPGSGASCSYNELLRGTIKLPPQPLYFGFRKVI